MICVREARGTTRTVKDSLSFVSEKLIIDHQDEWLVSDARSIVSEVTRPVSFGFATGCERRWLRPAVAAGLLPGSVRSATLARQIC